MPTRHPPGNKAIINGLLTISVPEYRSPRRALFPGIGGGSTLRFPWSEPKNNSYPRLLVPGDHHFDRGRQGASGAKQTIWPHQGSDTKGGDKLTVVV